MFSVNTVKYRQNPTSTQFPLIQPVLDTSTGSKMDCFIFLMLSMGCKVQSVIMDCLGLLDLR